ncbi:MAG: hypothetical protein ACYTGW_16810 [Planctomycetota bacterium]|jgi:hypothetical protein
MRTTSALGFLLALPVVLGSLAAQTSPLPQTTVEGNNAAFYPIGYFQTVAANRQVHYQQVHDDVTKKAITGMAFRRDSKGAYFYDVPAFWVDIEVALSTAMTTARTISNAFASNEGGDRKVVLQRGKVNFAKATKFHNIAPQPLFAYNIKFTTPFVWTTPKSLCWDMKLYGSNLQTVTGEALYLDAVNVATKSIPGFSLDYGRGCFSSNPGIVNSARTVTAFSIDPGKTQLTLSINGCHFTPNSQGFAMLGVNRTSFGGQTLPLDLSALGAPGCSLLQSWDAQVPVKMNFKGNLGNCGGNTGGVIIVPVGGTKATGLLIKAPHTTALEAFSLYTQIYTVDPRANALQVVTGHASHAVVPLAYTTGLPANRLLRAGATALTSATGSRSTVGPWATIVNFN